MSNQTQQYLQEMGIDVWVPRGSQQTQATNPATTDNADWEQLHAKAMSCTACPLSKSRTHVVFGVGNQTADLMIVGEAPGYHEDKQGEPFVGRAGQLLNAMLAAIGFTRDDVYIANILKCRPPNNRDPEPEEVALCTDFLTQQIALIQPKAICAVGRIAAQFLLDTQLSLGKLRYKEHQYGEAKTPLFVTYHPAYLLRNPVAKGKTYQDLLLVKALLER